MKVILLKSVPELGEEGDIKDVALGHARNFLIPKGLAEEATEQKLAEIEAKKAKQAKKAKADLEGIEALIQKLEGQTVEIKAKASEEGTLYAALSPAKIATAFQEKGFNVKKEQIDVGHIKELGEHELTLDFDHGLEARITLIINSE